MPEKPEEEQGDPDMKCAQCGHSREDHDLAGCDAADPQDDTKFCDCDGWVEPGETKEGAPE